MPTTINDLMPPVAITDDENDEYTVLLERLSAYHSLRLGLKDHPELMEEMGMAEPSYRELYRDTYRAFKDWWRRMDEKYLLVHDENSVLMVDVYQKRIFPQPKEPLAQD